MQSEYLKLASDSVLLKAKEMDFLISQAEKLDKKEIIATLKLTKNTNSIKNLIAERKALAKDKAKKQAKKTAKKNTKKKK